MPAGLHFNITSKPLALALYEQIDAKFIRVFDAIISQLLPKFCDEVFSSSINFN